ncbi:MAG: TetR/AcrR family transcriptional regulator [Chloroflexales bacterium]|nr:TetR/AcrR family transcriptional regulator [Chloroflexales bacterium]
MSNRTQILAKALDLFAARGYDAVGVQAICEAVGVTKPTLYHYFGNKQGLLAALVGERSAQLLARLREATAYAGDLPLSLGRVVETYFQFATAEPALYRLILALWFTVPESEAFRVVAALNGEQQRLVAEMFERAAADHGNMRGRHQLYAASFLGAINTYIALALNGYLQLTPAVARQAVHQFSHGIYS